MHTTVVLRRYLSDGGPPVSLHDSCHSPSTSLINELILPTGLPLTRCFLFFCLSHYSRDTLDTVMREKPRRACTYDHTTPTLKSFRSLILPILTFNRTVTECPEACLPALYNKTRPLDSLSVRAFQFP